MKTSLWLALLIVLYGFGATDGAKGAAAGCVIISSAFDIYELWKLRKGRP